MVHSWLLREYALHNMDMERFHLVGLGYPLPELLCQDVQVEHWRKHPLHCQWKLEDTDVEGRHYYGV